MEYNTPTPDIIQIMGRTIKTNDTSNDIIQFMGRTIKPNETSNNWLVQIDDDLKYIKMNNPYTIHNIKKLYKSYYPNSEISFINMPITIEYIIDTLINENHFFKNSDFNQLEFVQRLEQLSIVMDFMKRINPQINLFEKQTINESELENYLRPKDSSNMTDNLKRVFDINETSKLEGVNAYDNHELKLVNINNNKQGLDLVEIRNIGRTLLVDEEIEYVVYYNNQFNKIFFIPLYLDFINENQKLGSYFKELQLITKCILSPEKVKELNFVSNDIWLNYQEALATVNRIINQKQINTKLSTKDIKSLIEKYFVLDNDIDKRVKFSTLWSIITSEITIDENISAYMKRQLPNILIEFGLNKKRYSDGIYWYGLKRKVETNHSNNEKLNASLPTKLNPKEAEEFENKFQSFVSSRKQETEEINLFFKNSY